MDTNENSGSYTFMEAPIPALADIDLSTPDPKADKPKRGPIRPRVLKSDYDLLQHRYRLVKLVAIVGWILFAIALGSCTPIVINGIRVQDRTQTKVDNQTKFYCSAAFLIGAGLTTHFHHRDK